MISDKLKPFGTTIFSEMTRLAHEHQAINLSQGFPDFEGPSQIVEAACEALRAGHNQYARSMGALPLVEAIATHQKRFYDLNYDARAQVVVFSGATEGLMSSMLGLLNPGDEVVLFEPFYDSYPACLAMAGAVPKYYTLRFPDFAIDEGELEALFSDKTKLIVLNTPHNPTGKVFTEKELQVIARLAQKYDAMVLTDEVYEHLTYGDAVHTPIATLPGMYERTLSLSSTGKTYSFTGWKVGWGTGPQPMIAAAQAAHQFVTFATASPLQHAVAHALNEHAQTFYDELKQMYEAKRAQLLSAVERMGLTVAKPDGTYFLLANFSERFSGSDIDFAKHLIEKAGVATIPPSGFYKVCKEEGQRLIRFAFCKRKETLDEAVLRLQRLKL